ncbi:MAG TPA: 23S rRNA (adenine(2503)-C(2))-methyltransferase RlmN, partial [Rhizobiales bacterium]|nr:23S rRNA (adenine(2503)-C(2))-methyltransferase RlmN [Hyphomicrobiales bacterium]
VPEKARGMRVAQVWNWIYARGATDFARMTVLSKDLRAALAENYSLERPEIVTEQVSADGTRKWLLRLRPDKPGGPGPLIETVYIPEPSRGTLCISSQIGCTLTCSFCHTGTQKLVRNLSPGEIAGQIMLARDRVGDWPGAQAADPAGLPEAERKITNIVLMGMGEPLYNFENVRDAMAIAAASDGLAFSKRRITLSTSGVVPQIPRWGAEAGTMLAISLHGVRDELRDELVPINRKWPIAELLGACRAYPSLSNARRITFEYVMLKGLNDSIADAKELVRLLAGIPAKINLIPFNAWPGAPYECSEWEQIEAFAEVVNKAGYASPVRSPRGRDIMAACGQLKSESVKQRASERRAEAAAP